MRRQSIEAVGRSIIKGTTRVLGVIGHPVTHSWSPQIHNAACAALGLDYVYVPLTVKPADLAPAVRAIRALGFHGLNVTIPHKEAMVPLMNRLTPMARLIGAVNTVEVAGRRLIGHNTDGQGFLAAYHEQVPGGLAGRHAVLIGAGGAARAVAVALASQGLAGLIMVNRTSARAEAMRAVLTRRFRRLRLKIQIDVLPLQRLMVGSVKADLVINATPLGMAGYPPLPFSPKVLVGVAVACDLVYRPRMTAFLQTAQAAGIQTVDGTGMLLHQAALAFEIWTGQRAPLAAMRMALKKLAD